MITKHRSLPSSIFLFLGILVGLPIILLYLYGSVLIHELGHLFFMFLYWHEGKIEFLTWSNWSIWWLAIFTTEVKSFKFLEGLLIFSGWIIFELIFSLLVILFCLWIYRYSKKNNKQRYIHETVMFTCLFILISVSSYQALSIKNNFFQDKHIWLDGVERLTDIGNLKQHLFSK